MSGLAPGALEGLLSGPDPAHHARRDVLAARATHDANVFPPEVAQFIEAEREMILR
jgi:hypothetical protein